MGVFLASGAANVNPRIMNIKERKSFHDAGGAFPPQARQRWGAAVRHNFIQARCVNFEVIQGVSSNRLANMH